MTTTERSFRDAYGVLQQHAESLRDQTEPNIDDLLTIVTESVEAYRVCKQRIDAVEAALKAALNGVDAEAEKNVAPTKAPSSRTTRKASPASSPAPSPAQSSAPPATDEFGVGDDDIPF